MTNGSGVLTRRAVGKNSHQPRPPTSPQKKLSWPVVLLRSSSWTPAHRCRNGSNGSPGQPYTIQIVSANAPTGRLSAKREGLVADNCARDRSSQHHRRTNTVTKQTGRASCRERV